MIGANRLQVMTSCDVVSFDEFVRRYPYPGRVIVVGQDVAGVRFAAYWLTGRSPESRSRRFTIGADALDVHDVSPGAENDPLRHYTAITRAAAGRVVVGNGTHVAEITALLDKGVNAFDALAGLEYEPDPPIFTPRITAVASMSPKSELVLAGAVPQPVWPDVPTSQGFRGPAWPDRPGHNLFHVARLTPTQCYGLTTYSGDTENVTVSGQPTAIAVDGEWPELLGRIWDGLNPALRVAAAVVPLVSDLREGRFAGLHEPVVLARERA